MSKRRRIIFWVGGISISILLIVTICFLLFRQVVLEWAVQKVASRLKEKNIELSIGKSEVLGFTGASLTGITLVPENGDTLVTCGNLKVTVEFWPLLRARIRPAQISVSDLYVYLHRKDGEDNFSWLLKREKKKDTTATNASYAALCDRMLDLAFGFVPKSMEGRNLQLFAQIDTVVTSAGVPEIYIRDHIFSSQMWLREKENISHFNASGRLSAKERVLELVLNVTDNEKLQLPLLEGLFKARAGFQSIELQLKQEYYRSGTIALSGKAEVKGLFAYHAKLAPAEVEITKAGINFYCHAGEDEVVLDSTSSVYMNGWSCAVYGKYDRSQDKLIELKAKAPSFEAQTFFDALPAGMFTALAGIKVKGKLSYDFHLAVRLTNPDSVLLNSTLKRDGFAIEQFGKVNLALMNSAFLLPVYDKGVYLRTLDVSELNPNFIAFANIPDKLKTCVLTSEDGSFMWHKGFNEEAFAKSITANLKAGRFKRGGSTISMQLVKNIFLNKNKTISRKLEEILMVWLMENQRITSKQRMLEVYFNIIEWGPNVYGVGEASMFYFSKQPSALTLNECIFLTSIIPKPKHYKWSFDQQGHLKPHLAGYYNLLSNIMLRRGQITQEERDAIVPDVVVIGKAREGLALSDSTMQIIPEDSMIDEEVTE